MRNEPTVILLADDDPDDRSLATDAFNEGPAGFELRSVCDGEELLEYLRREKRYASPVLAPHPAVVLLDLNMPRMDGRGVLEEMQADPALRRIPVFVLSTSHAPEDVALSYDLGACAYIGKPVTFAQLLNVFRTVEQWLGIVLPAPRHTRNEDDLGTSSEGLLAETSAKGRGPGIQMN